MLSRLSAAIRILLVIAAPGSTGGPLFEVKVPQGIDFTLQNSPEELRCLTITTTDYWTSFS